MSEVQKKPIISIIIPAFNAEKYIESAITSVLDQSIKDIEVVVVNDGSTDRTKIIVENIARNDARLILINQLNSGKPSVARNVGITNSSSEYIAFLDADDTMLPEKLATQLSVFEQHSDIVLLYHDYICITSENELSPISRLRYIKYLEKAKSYLVPCGNNTYLTTDNFYNFMSTNMFGISTVTVMIKREVLYKEEEWFPENMDIGEDLDLWLRTIKKYRAAFIDKVYSQVRKHPDSITQNPERMIFGLITAQKRNLTRARDLLTKKEIKLMKHQLASKYRKLGYLYWLNNNRPMSRKCYKESFYLRPGARQVLSILKTFIPWRAKSSQTG